MHNLDLNDLKLEHDLNNLDLDLYTEDSLELTINSIRDNLIDYYMNTNLDLTEVL